MKIVILDKNTLGDDIDVAPIRALGEVDAYPSTLPEEVAERVKDTDVIVANKIKLGEHNLENAKNVRLICVTATGYDNIDTLYCKKRGIALCNVPGYSTESVAQLTLCMALSLVMHLPAYADFVNSGAYSASGVANRLVPVYHEISSLTWGVVGGGGIGGRVASVAKALGAKVLMCRRQAQSDYESADIDTLCEKADIISLHVPLTEDTRGMISRERIAKMKNGVILINVARGAVTDERALADAIISGKLGGIGIDVYSAEPLPKEHPFTAILGRENVLLTPHMAWGAKEARERCVFEVAENIRLFFENNSRNRIV